MAIGISSPAMTVSFGGMANCSAAMIVDFNLTLPQLPSPAAVPASVGDILSRGLSLLDLALVWWITGSLNASAVLVSYWSYDYYIVGAIPIMDFPLWRGCMCWHA